MTKRGRTQKLHPGLALPPATHTPDEVDLFLFSAACWLPHRIHYDRDYARLEGHADLLVHGPLQGAYLLQSVVDALQPEAQVVRAHYRHLAPSYVDELLECRPVVAGVEALAAGSRVHVTCEILNHRRNVVTTAGSVEVWIPYDGIAAEPD